MKSFRSYLAEATKEYSFRVKTLVAMDDAFLDKLEKALRKYGIVDIGAPKRTAAQKNPLDFPHVSGLTDVYMVDVILSIPASSSVLAQDIRNVITLSDSQIVVRGKHEAVELVNTEVKAAEDIAKEADGRDLTPAALLNDAEYLEATDTEVQYGNEYNQKFLNYLAQIAANREEITFDGTEVKKSPRFAWLKKESAQDFNDGIDGIKPGEAKAGKTPKKPSDTGLTGVNLEDEKVFKRTFVDDKGEKRVVVRDTKQVRKD